MTHKDLTFPQNTFSVSAKERKLLEELRKVRFGRVEVIMSDGQPDHIDKIKESIKL